MDIKIVNRVYNTKGDELLRYVRYEVMEGLEIRELIEDTDEDKYDALVKDVMDPPFGPLGKKRRQQIICIV